IHLFFRITLTEFVFPLQLPSHSLSFAGIATAMQNSRKYTRMPFIGCQRTDTRSVKKQPAKAAIWYYKKV
ncbi:MAG: hypothetical protein IIY77_03300, partial [Lachnospiraceae bacterium]|nr:hypothetical protein [Lachnospiraceae bacterium]